MTTTRALQSSSTLAECRQFTQRYQVLQARRSKNAAEQKNSAGCQTFAKHNVHPKLEVPRTTLLASPCWLCLLTDSSLPRDKELSGSEHLALFFCAPKPRMRHWPPLALAGSPFHHFKWCQAVILSRQKSLTITAFTASRAIFRTSIIRRWQSHPFLWYCFYTVADSKQSNASNTSANTLQSCTTGLVWCALKQKGEHEEAALYTAAAERHTAVVVELV